MRRGDVVVIAAAGDNGKPRPAVIVQTDALPEAHVSVVVCQMTSDIAQAADFRVTIEPAAANGLRSRSQVMVDKPVTVRRVRVGSVIGRLTAREMRLVNAAMAFVMGLSD